MKLARKTLISIGAALALGLAASAASAQPGYGPGYYGMGPGMMGGYGPGYGMGPGMMGGYGPGYGMGPGGRGGYGPGYGMGPGARGGYGPGWMHGYGRGGWGMGPGAMFGGFAGNVDENLSALKSQLGITEKQDSAWQAFTKNAKQQSEASQAWFTKMFELRGASTAPEFLEQRAELMKQRQAQLEANASALKNLYAALSPEQKAIADQSFGGYGPAYCLQGYNGPRGRVR